jgi:hypothetical protein
MSGKSVYQDLVPFCQVVERDSLRFLGPILKSRRFAYRLFFCSGVG